MQIKKISTITIAVCAVSFMLLFADNGFLQSAYAFSTYSVNTNTANNSVGYDATNKLYVIKDNALSPYVDVTTVSSVTGTVNTLIMPTPASSGTYGFDISCINGECFIAQDRPASAGDFIIGFNPVSGTIMHNVSITSIDAGLSTISGGGNAGAQSFGYLQAVCTSGNARILISALYSKIGSCSGTNFGANDIRNAVSDGSTLLGVISDNAFSIWNINTGVRSCNVAITTGSNPLGTLSYYGGNWYGTNNNLAQIGKFSSSCVQTTNFITGHGLTTINHIEFSSDLGSVFISSSTATAVMNITSSDFSTLMYTIGYGTSGASTDTMSLAGNMNQIGLMGSSTFRIVQVQPVSSGGTGGGSTSEFCALPENINVLICRLQNNAGALTSASESIEQSGNNIACQIRIISCTQGSDGNFTPDNPDMKTNGIGYIFTMVLLGVMVCLFWVASRGDLTSIPTFLWFIATLAVLGACTTLQWIDPTFLVIGVIAIAGFAVAKARNVFGGGLLNESLS